MIYNHSNIDYSLINTKDRYNKYLKSGLFEELYPSLSGTWTIDKSHIRSSNEKYKLTFDLLSNKLSDKLLQFLMGNNFLGLYYCDIEFKGNFSFFYNFYELHDLYKNIIFKDLYNNYTYEIIHNNFLCIKDENGVCVKYLNYKYPKENNKECIKSVIDNDGATKIIYSKRYYEKLFYDKHLLIQKEYYNNGDISKEEWYYNYEDDCTEHIDRGGYSYKYEYEYDKRGNVIKKISINNNIIDKYKYIFDDNDRLIEILENNKSKIKLIYHEDDIDNDK
ncbi:MAG: hypothetical protein P8X70_01510 [Nanoarchaeota archaeon]